MPSVRVDGMPVYYRKMGQSGPAVLLVHGFCNSSMMWVPHLTPFLGQFRFFMPDLPGYGRSKKCLGNCGETLEIYCRCIKAICEKENLESYSLVGFSLGAYTCLYGLCHEQLGEVERYLHLDHPAWSKNTEDWPFGMQPILLKKFASLCELGDRSPDIEKSALRDCPQEVQQQYTKILLWIAEHSLSRPVAQKLGQLIQSTPLLNFYLIEQVAAFPWAYAMIRHFHAGTYDLRELLGAVAVKTSVISTENSKLFQSGSGKFVANQLRRATHIELRGTQHDFIFSHPLRFHQLLKKWLLG